MIIVCLIACQVKQRDDDDPISNMVTVSRHGGYDTYVIYIYANQKLGDGTHPGVSHLHKLPRVSTFPGDQVLGNPF